MELRMSYQEARQQLINEGYVNVDIFVDPLIDALQASMKDPRSMNGVFHGPPGYGKSTIPMRFIELVTGIAPYKLNVHKALDYEDSFGGLNLPDFQKGIRRLNTDQSWIKHDVVIWEEGFDGSESWLAANKDPITSGFVNGDPVETKLIIICTNLAPNIFDGKQEMIALRERFPISILIDWENLSPREYQTAAETIVRNKGLADHALVATIGKLAAGNRWSPRRIGQVAWYIINRAEARDRQPIQDDLLAAARNIGFDATDLSQKIIEAGQQRNAAIAEDAFMKLVSMHRNDVRNYASFQKSDSPGDDLDVISEKIYQLRVHANEIADTRSRIRELEVDAMKYGHYGTEISTRLSGELTELLKESKQAVSNLMLQSHQILDELTESGREKFTSVID